MTRLLRPAMLAATALALSGALTLVAAATMGGPGDPPLSAPAVDGRVAPAALLSPTVGDPAGLVASLQSRLRVTPGDHRSWSTLALAYVEQARVTADPAYYRKADRALARAERLAPGDSVLLTARAAVEAARHDFTAALEAADRALDVNPYSAAAEAFRSDALTELGRYPQALRAARRADNLEPGPSTFARLSYAAELHGDLAGASRLMRLSRDASGASAPSYAFASFHLGELARSGGDLRAAARAYDAALEADAGYLPALAGRARIAVARGDLAAAERDYTTVVARQPLPEYVVELGDLYLATGRPQLAAQQFAVASAWSAIAKANGVRTDLETALFEADHGSARTALLAARAEWAARRSIHPADALGWALHAAGKDRAALRYVRLATRLGTIDARLLFHRGVVEAAVGHDRAARTYLLHAVAVDGGVAPLREQQARDLLADLGGPR